MMATSSPPRRASGIIDAHAHVWTLDTATYPWQPTFGFVPTDAALPDSLLAAMDQHGVAHAILVQPSAYGRDHRFLLDTVHRHPDRFLPVGLVDPADSADSAIAASLVHDGCVGLRVNLSLDLHRATVQADASGWESLAGLGVPICLRATPAHHELVMRILARHRELSIVIDHLGLPEPDRQAVAIERFTDLAGFEGCYLKIAGLVRLSAASAPYRDVWPLVEAAVRVFGASRLVWGSDFPATDPAIGYLAPIQAMECMSFIRETDRKQMMAGTARELWGP
jgi:predicted TIM-barrel fold metal-dependent hydrolase